MKPKNAAQRQAEYKARQMKGGRVRRYIYATPAEHKAINQHLAELRKKKPA